MPSTTKSNAESDSQPINIIVVNKKERSFFIKEVFAF